MEARALAAVRDWLGGYIGEFSATLVLGVSFIMGFLAFNTLLCVWLERKISGHIQRRRGPLHVGPHGTLQTVADMIKLMGKQLLTPVKADRWVFLFAPVLIFVPVMALASLIPLAGAEAFADLPIGLVVLIAMSGISVLAIFMGGWASNNKYAVLGGMRSVNQVIAYEIPMLLSVLAVVMIAQSLNLRTIVEAQAAGVWFALVQPVAAVVYLIAITAETNRAPFDIPEAESELVAGFHTEYPGMRFAFFFFAEYSNMIVLGALGATLFLGGYSGPFLPGWVWLLIKAYAFVLVAMWIRWTYPRLRFDQLMNLAWKALIPIALVNLVVTALVLARIS
jgi:NADH-quinone oxidoreductase subunit H